MKTKTTSKKLVAKKVTTSKTSKTPAKSKAEKSVETGIKVIKTALKKNLSLNVASKEHKLGKNYVYDVRSKIKKNYDDKKINRETYREFTSLINEYNG